MAGNEQAQTGSRLCVGARTAVIPFINPAGVGPSRFTVEIEESQKDAGTTILFSGKDYGPNHYRATGRAVLDGVINQV